MKIKKGGICPICFKKITKPNIWVIYHISYAPQMQILACKYCNYIEYCLRNKKKANILLSKIRVERVIAYQRKFGIIL